MKEFDLNIETVLENWNVSHALREIIANALDEQVMTNSKEIELYFDAENKFHIRDYGRGINYIHFTQNENEEKLKHTKLIGRFGVGLKDALATFDRNNNKVNIISKYGTISMGKAAKYGFNDLKTLHVYFNEATDINFVGTEFIIENCTEKDVNTAKEMFLKFSKAELYENTDIGEIYKKNDKACIYINGVKVAEEDKFMFSYNITSITKSIKNALNRERTNVGRSAYTERVKGILLQAKKECVTDKLISEVNKHQEGTMSDEMKWSDVYTHAVGMLHTKQNVVFVTSSDMERASGDHFDILKKSGKEIIVVSEDIKAKIINRTDSKGGGITTFSTIMENYQESFEYSFVEYAELNKNEMQIFDITQDIVKLYNVESMLAKICISETIKPSIDGDTAMGVWDPSIDKIVIKRCQLKSIENYAGTLIHELIHAYKNLDDVDREFESELTRLIGILIKGIIDSSSIKQITFENI